MLADGETPTSQQGPLPRPAFFSQREWLEWQWQVLEKGIGAWPPWAHQAHVQRRPAASVSGCPHGSHELCPNSVPVTVRALTCNGTH